MKLPGFGSGWPGRSRGNNVSESKNDKLKAAARWLHAVWWFREARGREGKRIMIREWNALYPGVPIKLRQMYRENKTAVGRRQKRKEVIINGR